LILLLVPGVANRFIDQYDMEIGGRHPGSRLFIWERSLKMIRDNPMLGVGKGNFREVYGSYMPEKIHPVHRVGTAHNDFLHTAAISGLPGLLLYSLLWGVVFIFGTVPQMR